MNALSILRDVLAAAEPPPPPPKVWLQITLEGRYASYKGGACSKRLQALGCTVVSRDSGHVLVEIPRDLGEVQKIIPAIDYAEAQAQANLLDNRKCRVYLRVGRVGGMGAQKKFDLTGIRKNAEFAKTFMTTAATEPTSGTFDVFNKFADKLPRRASLSNYTLVFERALSYASDIRCVHVTVGNQYRDVTYEFNSHSNGTVTRGHRVDSALPPNIHTEADLVKAIFALVRKGVDS